MFRNQLLLVLGFDGPDVPGILCERAATPYTRTCASTHGVASPCSVHVGWHVDISDRLVTGSKEDRDDLLLSLCGILVVEGHHLCVLLSRFPIVGRPFLLRRKTIEAGNYTDLALERLRHILCSTLDL